MLVETYEICIFSRWELTWGCCKSCSLCRRIWLPSELISSNMTRRMSDRQKLPTNSGAPVSLPFHREFMLFACVYVLIVFFECWCSLLVSRGLYLSLDVGFLVAHSVFLIIYHAFKIQSEMTKRCKEAECWTFSGKSTHSSWQIRLLLIIFGTYISMQLNRVYMCPFVWSFKYVWATDSSDHWPFGLSTFRTNDPSA